MATVADLQAAFTEMETQATANTDAEAAAAGLLDRLGTLLEASKTDPAAIQAIADGLRARTGVLKSSNDILAAAIVKNTPVETPVP